MKRKQLMTRIKSRQFWLSVALQTVGALAFGSLVALILLEWASGCGQPHYGGECIWLPF